MMAADDRDADVEDNTKSCCRHFCRRGRCYCCSSAAASAEDDTADDDDGREEDDVVDGGCDAGDRTDAADGADVSAMMITARMPLSRTCSCCCRIVVEYDDTYVDQGHGVKPVLMMLRLTNLMTVRVMLCQ